MTNRALRFRVASFLRIEDVHAIEFREFAETCDVVEQVLERELDV
jgi:hypothetical protein